MWQCRLGCGHDIDWQCVYCHAGIAVYRRTELLGVGESEEEKIISYYYLLFFCIVSGSGTVGG